MPNHDNPQDQDAFPTWDPAQPLESLERLKQRAVAEAQGRIDWYDRSKAGKKTGSRTIRVIAIVFGALGAICPLLDASLQNMRDWAMEAKVDLGEVGYVLLAIAAAVLAYDRYFGLSSGWIRYMESQLTIERLLKELEYDWALLRSVTWTPTTRSSARPPWAA